MDATLNILQSVQLPFALVPLIKFVADKKIMGPFALPKWQIVIATIFGTALFFMNFFILLDGESIAWYLILILVVVSLIYISMIIKAIIEPTSNLTKMT